MSKRSIQSFINKLVTLMAVASMVAVYVPNMASAAAITGRSLTLSTSAASASATYVFTFTVPSATAIKSASFTVCTTASGACTTPAGFTITGSTLTSQPTGLGAASGWTANTSTAGSLRILNASNATVPSGSQAVSFSTVTNPSATNATFFVRVTTYSDATWTTAIDTGTIAASTAGQVTVNATVDEALTFTLSAATVNLGTLTSATTGKDGSTTMVASTNGGTGYSITYTGNSLTSPSGALPSYAGSVSAAGTAGFGFNLMANTTPSVGASVSGSGSGTAFTGYSTANQYSFNSGDKVASATAATNSNTYTISYIANIAGSTPAGAYTTTLNYVATPNF